ncbi:MAG: hypothetical protein HOP18_11160 [Deltaproteobacteria bacterium]|nr:hypothetical protein [Deltaproteobacteria bacterium]
MRWSTRKSVLLGLAVGLIISGGTILWMHEQSPSTTRIMAPVTEPATPKTSQELAALAAEVARWKSEIQSDLSTLRSQLANVDRDQGSTNQQLDHIADKINQLGSEEATSAAGDKKDEGAPLTSEQERERERAHNQAELTLMEGTLRAETPDPAWASTAQLALRTTFHQEERPGIQIVDAECRRTLCRMELALDSSTTQDSYRTLPDLVPWSAPIIIQVDTETGAAVMYLAREEHSLPRMRE